MQNLKTHLIAGLILASLGLAGLTNQGRTSDLPTLKPHGTAQQLVVDGKPFLILGGELANSTASDPASLNAVWPTVTATGLNTIFAPVAWEQIEPRKGQFDFSIADALIAQAQDHHVRLVILWFGAWKNSMSTYVPPYIKHDSDTYARARDDKGQVQDILSPF